MKYSNEDKQRLETIKEITDRYSHKTQIAFEAKQLMYANQDFYFSSYITE